jgi:hypothetical protein
MIIGLLFRMIPFLGPVMTLGGFLPRLLKLKREKAIHREAGEPFPQNYQAEIDAHTVRTQIAGWRLAAGVMTATTLGTGFLWYGATLKIQDAEHAQGLAVIEAAAARRERDLATLSFTNLKTDYDRLVVLNSEASKTREGLIAVKTKAKIKRAVSDAKIIDAAVDADSWLRIESASGTPGGVPASPVQPAGSVPSGAG